MISRPEQTKPQPAALPLARWISTKQVAAEFGVDSDTVLNWLHKGLPTGAIIPRRFHRRRGSRRHLFHLETIAFIRNQQVSLYQPKNPADTGQWLTAKALAAKFGLKCFSAYRWIKDGTIPASQVRRLSSYFIRISPAALAELEKKFESAHAGSKKTVANPAEIQV
jgi:predicted DNA-binding transcriptional regulator AlpA